MYFKFIALVARLFGLIMCIWSAIFIITMIIDQFAAGESWYDQSVFEVIVSITFFSFLFFIGTVILKKKNLFGEK